MILSLRELKSLIKESLHIPESGAVLVVGSEERITFVLWDEKALKEEIERLRKNTITQELGLQSALRYDTHFETFIFGSIELKRLNSPAWNATGRGWQVTRVAAKKGYGPVLYNIALGFLGPITSDRYTITTKSAGVWKGFEDGKSPGVTLKPLDDEKNPKTPTPIDDAPIASHSGDLQNKKDGGHRPWPKSEKVPQWRNSAAVGRGIPSDHAQKKSKSALADLAKRFKLTDTWLQKFLLGKAEEMWEFYF